MSENASIIPTYDFSTARNEGYLKKILPMMTHHQMAANPIHYAICYDYVVGNNATLSKAVDLLLSAEKPFDQATSLALYEKHICNPSMETFEKISHQIQKVITQAADTINDTCLKAEESSDSFQKKSQLLENITDAGSVKKVLQEIIRETQSLAITSHAMQDQLNQSNTEMEQLRAELAQVRQIAVTDGLTGLLNRRAFDQSLTKIIQQPESTNTYLSILDIDHFKRINDNFGHTVGDNVIKFVASLMKKHADEHHYVARYGGEELAIIMPETPKEKAIEISENIRLEMEKSRLKRKTDNQQLGQITISIGIAELQYNDDSEAFITRADTALYKAKESGRNKVVH